MKRPKEVIANVASEPIRANVVKIISPVVRRPKGPGEKFGSMFNDIQTQRVFDDSKTFVDLIPNRKPAQIRQSYRMERNDPNFNLQEFINRNFYHSPKKSASYLPNVETSIDQHISSLWQELRITNRLNRGSLLALPYPYVVPGGRFREQFYWDSYFIMLGLAREGDWRMIEGMMKNYAYMIRKFGLIPTANRSYFLSRSQPPFLSHMVRLLAKHQGETTTLSKWLPYLLAERHFWMQGLNQINKKGKTEVRRVVRVDNNAILNRYFDDLSTPRPESHEEDVSTASALPESDASRTYVHLRAAAESGWDFSSRWFRDPGDIRTIETTDILPVDLNCLLYHLDITIADAYKHLRQRRLERSFRKAAARRADLIQRYFWDEQSGFYYDYNFSRAARTERLTLAGIFPLYVGIANEYQAEKVASKIEQSFLKDGGLLTTTAQTGQQWDAPNGWAPLHHVAYIGLKNYGYDKLANEIRNRWAKTNLLVYKRDHKLIEKYNVVNHGHLGGGGEYPLQDGFGWTNGVLEDFLVDINHEKINNDQSA